MRQESNKEPLLDWKLAAFGDAAGYTKKESDISGCEQARPGQCSLSFSIRFADALASPARLPLCCVVPEGAAVFLRKNERVRAVARDGERRCGGYTSSPPSAELPLKGKPFGMQTIKTPSP